MAALLVLVFHLSRNTPGVDDPTSEFSVAVTTTSGLVRSGIAVFFVISGFVIAYTSREMRTGDWTRRFIA